MVTELQPSCELATPVALVLMSAGHSSTRSDGQLRVGLMVSRTVIVWVQLALLPQPSVAVQVRRMLPLPVQLALPTASTKLMFATPLQVSVAVATPVLFVVGDTVHSRVMAAGQVMTGATVSWKRMVCTQLALLPQPSVAVQVRTMAPLP